jgi:hypothetical protein
VFSFGVNLMSNESSEPSLESKLSRFETQLETPVVPGELTTWLQAAEQTFSQMVPDLRTRIEGRHRELIDEIAEQDQGLLTRVEQLRVADQEILAEAKRQFKMLSPMAEHSETLEPDEGHAARAVERIVDEGLKLVIRIRKQEAAISTWLMEAFDRDRGVAD